MSVMRPFATPRSQQQAVSRGKYEGAKNTGCVDTKSNDAKQTLGPHTTR